jgi:hypothetical protein
LHSNAREHRTADIDILISMATNTLPSFVQQSILRYLHRQDNAIKALQSLETKHPSLISHGFLAAVALATDSLFLPFPMVIPPVGIDISNVTAISAFETTTAFSELGVIPLSRVLQPDRPISPLVTDVPMEPVD